MVKYINQQNEPRVRHGIDFGAPARVLVQHEGVRLVWRAGHTYWAQVAVWKYQPATLEIIGLAGLGEFGEDLHEGGRMMAAVKASAKRINDVFGDGVAEQIKANKTLVV